MASLHINLDSTLGAAFLGGIVAGMYVPFFVHVEILLTRLLHRFYGITCVQAFIYYEKNYKDSATFRILVNQWV